MGCKNYSHKLFNFVESWRVQSPTFDDFKIWLNDFFKEEDYNAILEAIEDGTWNEEFRKSFTPGQDASLVIKSLDDDGFLEEKSPSPNIMSLYQDPIYGGSIAMNRTIREFEDEIVKRLIYDQEHRKGIDTSIVLPNGVSIVNHKLLAFKKELLQKLWNITGIDRSGNYNSDEEFTQMVNLTLKDFEFLLMSRSDEYIDAYGDYIKLKAFDTLLKGLDFIVIKDAYKNSRFIGANMYDYRGPQMKRDASIGKETAEISDYTGSVIKLLLKNCFRRIKKVNGQSKPGAFITEVSFNRAMTEVIKWYMYEDGAYIDPSGYEKLLSGDKDLDYGSLIDIYLANHTSRTMYQSIIESILNGAREQIFSRDSGLTSYIMGCFQRHLQDVFSQVYLQYGENINTKAIENKVTTDYFVELQSNNIENIVRIQSRSWKPYLKKRDTEVKGAFQDVLKKHNIQINGEAKTVIIDGHVYSLTGNKVKDSNSLVYTIKSETPRSSSPITDEMAIELIRDILGIEITEDYQSIVEGMDPERSLMSIFEGAIVLTLASASDEFDFITYKKSKLLNTFYYRNILQPVAVYLSEVYGEDSINVIKNTEGNALPLYSLGSLSKKLRRVINSLQDSSVAQYNPIVALPELLKREYIRSQTKIGDVIKDSKNLGPSEIMAVQQLNDFWLNLTKTSENPTIKVMPMTLSDKSTHTLYEINLNAYQIKGKSLAVYLKGIGTDGASDNVRKILQNEFSEREGLKIKQQLINIVSAYASVYKFDFNEEQAKDDLSYLKIKIDYVNGILKTKKSVNQVKTDFGQNRFVDVYYCDFDFEGNLSINPQLLYEADIHLFKTIKFDEVVRDNEIDFIEDMRANRFKINKTLYPDVTVVGKDWYDPIANVIEPFLIYDENGDVIKDHTKEIDWTKCTFKLHPVMESYFYANMLINVPLQEVMLGSTYAYKSFVQTRDNKQSVVDALNVVSRWVGDPELTLNSSYEEIIERKQRLINSGIIDKILNSSDVDKKIALNKLIVKVGDNYDFKISSLLEVKDGEIFYDRLDKKAFYQQSMSLKLNDKMKRALIVGATITSPILDKHYCPPRQVNIAICKDFYGFAFNLSGKSNNKEPHDGSGWTSPYFSRAVNFGLFDGAVGKNKKTIGGYLDPDTLIFKEIKWAEFELSNQYRKRSFDESEMSAEVMFKKMHDRTISKAEMNKLDISHFYGKQIHKSKFYNSTITHTDDIYFFNPEDGNYYKILDVTSDRNTCTRTIVRVDLNGNHIGEIIPDDIPINSIYDLDQVFGGCFCKKLSSDGVLVDSDANSDIVYNIISENEWWDYIVHIVTNTSAFKTGVENVNEVATSKLDKYNNNRTSIFSRYDDTVLKTIKYDISNYGAIMDADHELDKSDNSVKEMGQVIAALIQEGASIDTVNEIYSAIGKLAYASMSDLIEAHERFLRGDKEKLVLELGKAVIEAFESRSQNNIALAYAFLDSFSQNINMPFSSHAVSGVVLSSLGSKLTKLSLKTTYPGIGTVQVPSNGIMKYYEYNGKRYDYEGIVKELHRRRIPINDLYNVGTFTEEIVDENLIVTPSNKTLLSSNPIEINFEDTIVIYDAVTKTSSVVKISDVTTRDYYRNRFDWQGKAMFKWSVKSRDLLPQITRFTFNGERYTAWDLTSYRATAYATSLLDPEKFTLDDLTWMRNWLIDNFGITDFSEEILKTFITEQNRIFKETLDELSRIQKGEITSLTQDPFFTTVTNVKTDAAQIILGKRFMKQFGLRKGDDLSKITSSAFFVDRLTQQYALPSRAEVPSDLYDAVLYTKNGEQILVTISDQDDPRLAGTTLYTGETLALRGDKVWYNNEEELSISKNTKIRSKIINGKEYIILAVNSLDELKTLRYSSMTSMIRYNYNESNVRDIMSYEYDFDWDSDDIVDFNAFDLRSIGLEKGDVVSISDLTQLSNSDLTTLMRKIERDRIVSNIKDLAESRFVAFKKSLEAIGARIPAQSMQSFMSLEVVGFTESDVNDIYVPFTLTWVAGSDYDIDKVYVMQYTISDDGTLYNNTNLKGYTADALLSFPEPTGRTFIRSINGSGYRVTAEDVQNILKKGLKGMQEADSIIRILKQKSAQLVFDPNISDVQIDRVLNILNRHERFRMSEKHKQSALKNFIVHKIVSVIQDPKNQINVLTPVHTRKIKAASKNSALGQREKHLSLLTPTTTMIMQDQNMIGKTSIASSATGEKVYFHVLNRYSAEIRRLRELVERVGIDAVPEVVQSLTKLTIWNPIYNEWTLIGNTNVKPLIRALSNLLGIDLTSVNIEVGSKFEVFKNPDGTFNLELFLTTLHGNSNKTNCSEDMSEMVTTSTDNAKELDLKKINAIPETLDIFTYLISIGVDLSDILTFMKQGVMKVCVDFAKSSMFEPWIGSYNQFEQVVKFVKNEESLWGPDSYLFAREVTDVYDFWPKAAKIPAVKDAMLKLGIPLGVRVDSKMFPRFMKMFELNIPGVNLQEMFLQHLAKRIDEAKNKFKNSKHVDYDELTPDEMEQVATSSDYKNVTKYVDLYTYFKYTVIPKTNAIKSLLIDITLNDKESFSTYMDRYLSAYQERISNPLGTLTDILQGVKQQKFLGFAFGINKGLATSDFDEYEWIAKFNQRVNSIIYDYSQKPSNSNETFEAFDLIKFIKDEKYREDQLVQMEAMKHPYNVLEVIVNAEHTWNRIKSVAVLRDIVSTIGIFKFERDVVRKMLRQESINVSKQHTKRLTPDEWKSVRTYARNVFVWNWFARQSDLQIKLFENQIGFSSTSNAEPGILLKSDILSLDNELGLANFKLLVETELVAYLKNKYKDNQFIQKLITGGVTDKSGNVINFLKFPFSLSDVDGNPTYETMYSQILNDFTKIMFDEIDHENFAGMNWTIGDLFFVYNLYVNKESAGSDAMLKLFEDNVLYGNQLTTARSYYDYLSTIDKWGIYDETTNPNGVELKYKIEDLVYALRYAGEYKASTFGATVLTPDRVEIPNKGGLKVTSSPGYFLFNMPYLLNKDGLRFDLKAPTTFSVKGMRSKYSANLEDRSTIRAIIENMVRVLGSKTNIPIKVVDTYELKQLFADDNINVLASQKGFIKDGIVYINLDEATLDTPIHELAHIICAGMKYSLNNSVRNTYYTLLKRVDDESLMGYLGDFQEEDYANKHLSDIREEKLVRILSAYLKGAFEEEWNAVFNEDISPNKLSSDIVKTLFTILKITDVPESKFLGKTGVDFGRSTLEAILKSFNSKLFDLSGGWINTGVVIKSQRVATIKDRLYKLENLTIEGDC